MPLFLSGNTLAANGVFSPPYSDYGSETDGDSFFNFLVFNVSIDITEAGTFNLYGGLYDSTFSTLITDDMKQRTLSFGQTIVALEFDGIDIYNSQIDGPYGVWLVLYDMNWVQLDSDSAETSSYGYAEFQHDPARFSPPHYDYGLDENGNILFDYLIAMINVSVDVSSTYIIEGDLYDSAGDVWITDDTNQSYLTAGDHTLELQFLGFKIRKKEKHGPYRIELDISVDETHLIGEDTHDTAGYSYTDFDGSAAYFIDPSSDEGIDLDGDFLFDYLRVSVGVKANDSGYYEIQADLWDDAVIPNYVTSARNTTCLSQGTTSVDLFFLGSEIFEVGIDSKYSVEFELLDNESVTLDRWLHITARYNHDDFESYPPVMLNPPHDDYGLDPDSDGLYNHLVVDLSLDASAGGQYRLNASLHDSSHLIFIAGTENVADLSTGSNIVPLYFSGTDIHDSGIDGPYNTTIRLYDIYGNFLQRGYHDTNQYNCINFQHEIPSDNTPPSITDVVGIPDPQRVHENVNITALITDDTLVSGSWVSIMDPHGSPAGNFSMAYHATSDRYYHNSSYSIVGTYAFTIWAKDPYDNWNSSSSGFTMWDTSCPTIADVRAEPSPQEVHGPVNITATVSDNYQLRELWVNIIDPDGLPVGNRSMVLHADSSYYYESSYSRLGDYSFTIWAGDTSDNWNCATGFFTMEDSTLPIIANAIANPNPQILHGFVNISASVVDNFELSSVSIQITDPSSAVIVDSPMPYDVSMDRYYYLDSYHESGTFAFRISADDTSGNAESYNSQFTVYDDTIDLTPPKISDVQAVPDPQETGGYVNISAVVWDDIEVHGVWIEIFNPSSALIGNFTMDYDLNNGKYFHTSTYSDLGSYSFSIVASDAYNNWNSSSGEFLIRDMTPPVISGVVISPNPQAVHGWVEISAHVIDNYQLDGVFVDITDPNSIHLGNFTMDYDSLEARHFRNESYDTVGAYSFCIWAKDSSNNWVSHCSYFAVLDTQPPLITDTSADPQIGEVFGSVNISAAVYDLDLPLHVWIRITDPFDVETGNFSMLYDHLFDRYYYESGYDILGTYSYVIWAKDSTNNWSYSNGYFSVKDRTSPAISSVAASPAVQEVHGSVRITGIISDNYFLETVSVQVNDPANALIGNFSMSFDSLNGRHYYESSYGHLGEHSFVIYAKDSSDNWASMDGTFGIVDTTSPLATAGADREVVKGDVVVFDGSKSSDNCGIDSYVWTFNDGIKDVVLHGVNPEHTFSEAGNYTVTLTVTDTSGNSGQDTMYVLVNRGKPPNAPSSLVISETGQDFFILTWNAPTTNTDGSQLTNLKSYCVYRSLESGGPYTKIGTLIILNELYKDGGLDSGFTGYYVVTAVNSEGIESAYSNEASATIPEKGSISGSVVDENGDPVPGALVELKKDDSRILTVQTNENGNFSITDLDDGTYEVVINKKGYYTAIEIVVISEGNFVRLDSLALAKAPESSNEDLSVWIILIVLTIAIIAIGISVTLMLRKKRTMRKKD